MKNLRYTGSMVTIEICRLRHVLLGIMMGNGLDKEVADCTVDNLLDTELRGHDSHGIIQVPIIIDKIQKGYLSGKTGFEIVKDNGAGCMIDGLSHVGYYIAKKAMECCIQKARKFGIGIVTVKNSSHFGSAGYYSSMAINEGFVGISMSNTRALVTSTEGTRPIVGTNPISVGFPKGISSNDRFLLDMSTSAVSYNTIKQHAAKKEAIPIGWGVNAYGMDTTDPNEILNGGALLPLGGSTKQGGYKGFCLSLMVEMFCALLSGGLTSIEIGKDGFSSGHAFIVVDPDFFVGRTEFIRHSSEMFRLFQEESGAVYTPGRMKFTETTEINITKALYDSLMDLYSSVKNTENKQILQKKLSKE